MLPSPSEGGGLDDSLSRPLLDDVKEGGASDVKDVAFDDVEEEEDCADEEQSAWWLQRVLAEVTCGASDEWEEQPLVYRLMRQVSGRGGPWMEVFDPTPL